MRKQSLLTWMKLSVGSEQNIEVAGKPRCHAMVETHWVLSQERGVDLLLVGGDDFTQNRQVLPARWLEPIPRGNPLANASAVFANQPELSQSARERSKL
jgi:hypothetical protein